MAPDPGTAAAAASPAAGLGRPPRPPVLVESFAGVAEGLDRQQALAAEIGDGEACRVLAWRAPRGLIVGHADTRLPRFEAAVARLRDEGWPVVVRRSGGSACPVSPGTLQIALAEAVLPHATIDATYRAFAALIGRLLASFGLQASTGEMPQAFCPGRYDMSVGGRKLVGISQHWRRWSGRSTATTAAMLLVDDDVEELSRIVNLFYAAAGSDWRCSPGAIGSVRRALAADAPSGADLSGTDLMAALCGRLAAIVADGR